jgi:hypothetical protein
MRGSDGYLLEQHPVLITCGVVVLLAVVWLVLSRRR